ncbi:hypothetical protein [Saccharophagus sp. K07]|nr:hypothetical protein [Saccharophagus sp. K07]
MSLMLRYTFSALLRVKIWQSMYSTVKVTSYYIGVVDLDRIYGTILS